MAIQMYKGQVSEIVSNRDVKGRLEDGWTFSPSEKKSTSTYSRNKIKAKAEVEKSTTDLEGPEDLNNEEK